MTPVAQAAAKSGRQPIKGHVMSLVPCRRVRSSLARVRAISDTCSLRSRTPKPNATPSMVSRAQGRCGQCSRGPRFSRGSRFRYVQLVWAAGRRSRVGRSACKALVAAAPKASPSGGEWSKVAKAAVRAAHNAAILARISDDGGSNDPDDGMPSIGLDTVSDTISYMIGRC
jgi:hypothetical protein